MILATTKSASFTVLHVGTMYDEVILANFAVSTSGPSPDNSNSWEAVKHSPIPAEAKACTRFKDSRVALCVSASLIGLHDVDGLGRRTPQLSSVGLMRSITGM